MGCCFHRCKFRHQTFLFCEWRALSCWAAMSNASHIFSNKMHIERFQDRVSVDQNCMVAHLVLDCKNARKVDDNTTSHSSSTQYCQRVSHDYILMWCMSDKQLQDPEKQLCWKICFTKYCFSYMLRPNSITLSSSLAGCRPASEPARELVR